MAHRFTAEQVPSVMI